MHSHVNISQSPSSRAESLELSFDGWLSPVGVPSVMQTLSKELLLLHAASQPLRLSLSFQVFGDFLFSTLPTALIWSLDSADLAQVDSTLLSPFVRSISLWSSLYSIKQACVMRLPCPCLQWGIHRKCKRSLLLKCFPIISEKYAININDGTLHTFRKRVC